MIRTWEEIKAYLAVQGLVQSDDPTDDSAPVALTEEGSQVLMVLVAMAQTIGPNHDPQCQARRAARIIGDELFGIAAHLCPEAYEAIMGEGGEW